MILELLLDRTCSRRNYFVDDTYRHHTKMVAFILHMEEIKNLKISNMLEDHF